MDTGVCVEERTWESVSKAGYSRVCGYGMVCGGMNMGGCVEEWTCKVVSGKEYLLGTVRMHQGGAN